MFQIRRYVYHDVIRLDDATKLMDCAFVQVSHNSCSLIQLEKKKKNFGGKEETLKSMFEIIPYAFL